MTPSQLAAALTSIYGAALVGLRIAADATIDGAGIVTIPGRVGSAHVANVTGLLINTSGRGSVVQPASGVDRYLRETSATTKKTIVVVGAHDSLPTALNLTTLASNIGNCFVRASTTVQNTLQIEGTHYVDGVEGRTVAAGLHIYENNWESTRPDRLALLSEPGIPTRGWPGRVTLEYSLSGDQSPTQRAASAALLKSYCGIA